MAPANTPGRKKRENNFFDVGVQGRKTGIMLQDTGVRDEHGMEPLDGIFSSPEKSPPKRSSGYKTGGTVITSESMEVQESSIPEPTEILNGRHLLRSSRTMLPPPLARSPIKTALGSSPRRQSSTGPKSQARRFTSTPDRASPYPAVSRRLNFSVTEQDSDIEQETPAATNGLDTRNRGKGRADVYDLEVSPVRGQKRTYDESIVEEETSANGDSETGINGRHEETLLPPVEDESLQFVHGDNDTSAGSYEEDSLPLPEATPQPKKRLRTRRSNMIDSSQVEEEPSVAKPTRASNRVRGRGRGGVRSGSGRPSRSGKTLVFASNERGPSPIVQPKQKVPAKRAARSRNKAPEPSTEDEEESVVEQEPTADEESIVYDPPAAKVKGRRRSAGSKNVPVHKDKPSADKEEPVFKAQGKISKPKANPKSKPPPSERDPNAKIESTKKSSIPVVDPVRSPSKAASEGASVTSTAPKRPGVGRSLQILRQGTPMEDSGVRTTRFGRASVKPVDWWRNERIKYDPHGNKQAIVRAEEVEVPKLAKRAHKQRKREMSVVEEDEEELEDWEIEPGILTGLVTGWDEEVGVAMQDEEEQEVAYAPSAIDVRPVPSGNFGYAKIIGLPFFGAGVVELPPSGFKRAKNSRRMQMAFYVASGGVQVTVGDSTFTIHKGGVWQVPRGNFYSIENRAQKLARIFFAQACEVILEPEDDE